jgi:uncharacterized protein (DUF952 family)
MNLKHIYKIIENAELEKAKLSGEYLGSSKDIEDGYIHFSEEGQIRFTLEKYFKNKKNLILLKVHTLNLKHLIWEQASNGENYPHLYPTLDLKNIIDEFELKFNKDGKHIIPFNLD